MPPEDFKYTIKLDGETEFPSSDPIEGTYKEFSIEDKLMMAKLMVENFPHLNNELLEEYIRNYGGRKI